MKPSLNRGNLRTDFDAQGHKIINLPADQPLPPPVIPDGSITDIKIHPTAAIQQSKLALTDPIPPSFLGTTANTAAQGDLAEYKANKAQPNGYPSLDSGGKIPTSQFPALMGTGTVTTVSVATANGVSGTVTNPDTTPAITVVLGNITPSKIRVLQTDGTGYVALQQQSVDPTETLPHIFTGATARLRFASAQTNGFAIGLGGSSLTASHVADFPDKDGVVAFTSDLSTTMVGVGTGHKGGQIIDTGASGNPSDYLARDATWKSVGSFVAPSYQPQAVGPQLYPAANTTGPRATTIGTIGEPIDASIFYMLTTGSPVGPFILYRSGQVISVPPLSTIFAYTAKAGFTNSAFAGYTNPNTS